MIQEEAAPATPFTDALRMIGAIMYFVFRYVLPYVGFALSFGIAILPTMIDLRLRFDAWWMETPIYELVCAFSPVTSSIDPLISIFVGITLGLGLVATILKEVKAS